MPTSTPLQALPVPTATDPPNGPAQLLALGSAVEKLVVMHFATVADRNATVLAPIAGMVAFVSADGAYYTYNGTTWVAQYGGVMNFANAAARTAAIPSPVRGMYSWLADTGFTEVYYGPVIGWRPPWNTAWGVVALNEFHVAQTFTSGSATDLATANITFNAVANRWYRLTASLAMDGATGTATSSSLLLVEGSTIIQFDVGEVGTAAPTSSMRRSVERIRPSPGTVSVTYKLQCWASPGGSSAMTMETTAPGIPHDFIAAHDIGPSGSAPAT